MPSACKNHSAPQPRQHFDESGANEFIKKGACPPIAAAYKHIRKLQQRTQHFRRKDTTMRHRYFDDGGTNQFTKTKPLRASPVPQHDNAISNCNIALITLVTGATQDHPGTSTRAARTSSHKKVRSPAALHRAHKLPHSTITIAKRGTIAVPLRFQCLYTLRVRHSSSSILNNYNQTTATISKRSLYPLSDWSRMLWRACFGIRSGGVCQATSQPSMWENGSVASSPVTDVLHVRSKTGTMTRFPFEMAHRERIGTRLPNRWKCVTRHT